MHILFLSDNFPPEVNAPASRTFEHGSVWSSMGHQVTVITCAPNFPTGKVATGYRNKFWQSQKMGDVRVIRVWSYIAPNAGFIKRTVDYFSFMITSILAALFIPKVDIIVGTSPQFFTICAAHIIAVLRRRPWVLELRDIWPESIRAVGILRSEWVFKVLEIIEMFLYKRADAIVTVTQSFRDSLIRRGINGEKIQIVTNGVDLTRFYARKKDVRLVHELELKDKFVIGYIGTHGLAQNLVTILEAARLVENCDKEGKYQFIFLGDGASRTHLINWANKKNLKNVAFLSSVSKEDVVRYWSIVDIAIIHLKKERLFKEVIPSKLFECMAMGIPVMHGVLGESENIIKNEEVGIVFEPENSSMLCQNIIRLSLDTEYFDLLKRNGPIAAKKYDRQILARKMLNSLEAVVKCG